MKEEDVEVDVEVDVVGGEEEVEWVMEGRLAVK